MPSRNCVLRTACALLLTATLAACGGAGSSKKVTEPSTAPGFRTGWTALPAPPLVPRVRPALAFTGSGVLVWGGTIGTRVPGDGAAYDLESDRWRLLPPSPVPNLRVQASAWVAGRWILLGRDCAPDAPALVCAGRALTGMVFEPASDRWTAVVVPPAVSTTASVVSIGVHERAAWFGFVGPTGVAYASLRADTQQWTAPIPPGGVASAAVCGNGDLAVEATYQGRLADGSVVQSDPAHLRALNGVTFVRPALSVVDLETGNRSLYELPVDQFGSPAEPRLRCVGSSAVLVGARSLVSFDLDGRRWRRTEDLFGDVSNWSAVAGSRTLLLLGGSAGLLADPAASTPRALAVPVAAVTGVPADAGFAVYSAGQVGVPAGQVFVFRPS